jgi:Tfp pilus assembly protein FimT
VTLIELLVVVSIMMIVTVIAVPAMKPALENRKIREAARAANVYLSSARNRAIELGRPVGVLFIRDVPAPGNPGTPGYPCLTLQQVEFTPPYAGETTNAVAYVYVSGSVQNADGTSTYTVTINYSPAINTIIYQGGDLIQFGYQGPLYQTSATSENTATITLPPNCTLPWPTTAPGVAVPFQIALQPDNDNPPPTSAVAPLQLPSGTVIDLQASGTNNGLWFQGTQNSAAIVFSPAGGVYGVIANGIPGPLVDPVYFLVGRRDRMSMPVDGLANWQDPNNLWVTVTPQTGRITTVENVGNTAVGASMTNATIAAARIFALQGQSKGGR